ncbi:hypothetical protein [Nocardioides conyzicola]|uniref:hypothetical protein n=1 Tax=Nocardioides conyzicola TaxID=1651781 RepID=UPI0031E815D2
MLSTVHATIDADGLLRIDLDGKPHPTPDERRRSDLRSVLDEITAKIGNPVRVEVSEHDGTTYSDIVTPPADTPGSTQPTGMAHAAPPAVPAAGLTGSGFQPGENVAVACVLCIQAAGADGQAAVHLPPSLLTRPGFTMLLIGMTSANVAQIEPT